MGKTGKTKPAAIRNSQRTTAAIEARANGHPWAMVASIAGFPSPDAARVAVARALEAAEAESVATLRHAETAHLMWLRRRAVSAIEAGDTQAINTAVRIADRLAKLHCLDMPPKQQAPEVVDIQALQDEFLQLFDGELP